MLPEGVEPAGGHPGKVERGGAAAPDAGDFPHDSVKLAEITLVAAAADPRHACPDHGVGQLLALRHPQPAIVEKRAGTPLGHVELVDDRIVHDRRDELALAFECERYGEERDAVQEIRGAVERVDDPAVAAILARQLAALLASAASFSASQISLAAARRLKFSRRSGSCLIDQPVWCGWSGDSIG